MTEQTGAVAAFWNDVPDVGTPPPSTSTGLARLRAPVPSRRTALKGTMALGGALAFNVLGAVPTSWLPKAVATVGSEWTGDACAGYSGWSGYNNNTKICVGGTYGSSYCGTDGWFLNYRSPSWSSWPVVVCGTGGYSYRNAWRWPYGGRWYRCADGRQQVTGQASVFRICSKQLTS